MIEREWQSDLNEWAYFKPRVMKLLEVCQERSEALELKVGDPIIEGLTAHLEKLPKDKAYDNNEEKDEEKS